MCCRFRDPFIPRTRNAAVPPIFFKSFFCILLVSPWIINYIIQPLRLSTRLLKIFSDGSNFLFIKLKFDNLLVAVVLKCFSSKRNERNPFIVQFYLYPEFQFPQSSSSFIIPLSMILDILRLIPLNPHNLINLLKSTCSDNPTCCFLLLLLKMPHRESFFHKRSFCIKCTETPIMGA